MIGALLLLLGCELAGEAVRALLHLPVPGPVLGMILLAVILVLRDRGRIAEETAHPPALDTVSNSLIANMGLMFVPAGVGVIAEAHLLRTQWLPILGGLIGSTVLSLAGTALVMHHLAHGRKGFAPDIALTPPKSQP